MSLFPVWLESTSQYFLAKKAVSLDNCTFYIHAFVPDPHFCIVNNALCIFDPQMR